DLFDHYVIVPIKQYILDPIITAFQTWTGHPVTGPISDLLSQEFFNVFIAGVLLDTSDKPLFEDSVLYLSLTEILNWMGNVSLPNNIPVGIPAVDIAPPKPGWWNETILGPWPAPHWHLAPVTAFDIPLQSLLDLKISLPLSGLFRKLAALAKPKAYLKLHAYNLLAAANLFGTVPDTDARVLAFKYDNSWYMALAHRFLNVAESDTGV